MNFTPVSRALGNLIGISCHAKVGSLIWTIKIHLSEVCQQGSLGILNTDAALHWELIHHQLSSGLCTGFSEYMPF